MNKSSVTVIKARIIRHARALLDSNTDYLMHIGELWNAGREMYGDAWDTEFHIFGVIWSDTDHLPLSHVRKYYSSEALRRADDELEEIIRSYSEYVRAACEEIIARHEVS